MAGESRALTIARGARRRGAPREALRYTTDAHFLWRINAALQRLKALLAIQQAGERNARTLEDMTHVEYQIEKMLNDAQLVLIEQALPEEKRACDGL